MADRLQLFRVRRTRWRSCGSLERLRAGVYPRRIPEGWKPFKGGGGGATRAAGGGRVTLGGAGDGAVLVDKVNARPDKGSWRGDEVLSPVIFGERSGDTEAGELLAGQLWAETSITSRPAAAPTRADRFRELVLEVENWLKKTCQERTGRATSSAPSGKPGQGGPRPRADERRRPGAGVPVDRR